MPFLWNFVPLSALEVDTHLWPIICKRDLQTWELGITLTEIVTDANTFCCLWKCHVPSLHGTGIGVFRTSGEVHIRVWRSRWQEASSLRPDNPMTWWTVSKLAWTGLRMVRALTGPLIPYHGTRPFYIVVSGGLNFARSIKFSSCSTA